MTRAIENAARELLACVDRHPNDQWVVKPGLAADYHAALCRLQAAMPAETLRWLESPTGGMVAYDGEGARTDIYRIDREHGRATLTWNDSRINTTDDAGPASIEELKALARDLAEAFRVARAARPDIKRFATSLRQGPPVPIAQDGKP